MSFLVHVIQLLDHAYAESSRVQTVLSRVAQGNQNVICCQIIRNKLPHPMLHFNVNSGNLRESPNCAYKNRQSIYHNKQACPRD